MRAPRSVVGFAAPRARAGASLIAALALGSCHGRALSSGGRDAAVAPDDARGVGKPDAEDAPELTGPFCPSVGWTDPQALALVYTDYQAGAVRLMFLRAGGTRTVAHVFAEVGLPSVALLRRGGLVLALVGSSSPTGSESGVEAVVVDEAGRRRWRYTRAFRGSVSVSINDDTSRRTAPPRSTSWGRRR
jgi:hypothetical protein